ncbi:MAG: hypothetical protein GWN09_04635 [Gammaproteobacteria bacterium]|nr:hypothetical protein [Gammaproteobacteria bacterium]
MAKRLAGFALLYIALLVGAAGPVRAGHGVVYTPSFYPHEITIETVDPSAAAVQLEDNTLHAYVGSAPRLGRVPDHLKRVESLDAFLVLGFNEASEQFSRAARRCAVARGVLAALASTPDDTVIHPYPVTPFHPDYFHHLDRVEEAKAQTRDKAAAASGLRVRATGERARALAAARWKLDDTRWDVSLEEVPIERLVPPQRNAWLGVPWMKEGWFQAYRLLAGTISDPERRRAADSIYARLTRSEYAGLSERVNLERRLIEDLTRGCHRLVLGYTLRREYYNDGFSGLENVAYDPQLGLSSPLFIRTVKLKDFPWNGWLRLGTQGRPAAGWNPVAGFTELAGRLVWSAVGDPALLPHPYNGGWIPNRVQPQDQAPSTSMSFPVPEDALAPEPGSGTLRPVGEGVWSTAKVVYRVPTSLFQDGSEMEVVDLLYPYVLAFRWGVRGGDDGAYDPVVEAATALLRERLVAIRPLRVEREINEIAPDIQVPKRTAVVEIYLRHAEPDPPQTVAIAPPWSAVPWHVLVLMEEAVQRGLAAFSRREARRRGVAWLDLVRDRALHAKLTELIEQFEREGYRPAVLGERVDANAARERWGALRRFGQKHGHFVVTNGPYRLKSWSEGASVLEVVRELTYPHGAGSFAHYANPARPIITHVERDGERVVLSVDVKKTVQKQRTYVSVQERLREPALRGTYLIRPDSRYLVLDAEGSVVRAGSARMEKDGRFVLELPERLPGGRYTLVVAVYLDGNLVDSAVRVLSFEAS